MSLQQVPVENAALSPQLKARDFGICQNPPLIIDQPEEDLDNPVILEIVEQV
jgi:hypothetical protein